MRSGLYHRCLGWQPAFLNTTYLGCIIEYVNITIFHTMIKRGDLLQAVFKEECESQAIDCHPRPCSGIRRAAWLYSSIRPLKTRASISSCFIEKTKEKTKERTRGKEGRYRGSVDTGTLRWRFPPSPRNLLSPKKQHFETPRFSPKHQTHHCSTCTPWTRSNTSKSRPS